MREDMQEFLRNKIKDGLSKCTIDQRKLFNRMYVSIEEIPADKLEWALTQVEKTIEKNVARNVKEKQKI